MFIGSAFMVFGVGAHSGNELMFIVPTTSYCGRFAPRIEERPVTLAIFAGREIVDIA
jgi:hypothetical protein